MSDYPTTGEGRRAMARDGRIISPCCEADVKPHDLTRWKDAFECEQCRKVWVQIGGTMFEGKELP